MSRLLREACLASEIIKHRRKLKCLDEYLPLSEADASGSSATNSNRSIR